MVGHMHSRVEVPITADRMAETWPEVSSKRPILNQYKMSQNSNDS